MEKDYYRKYYQEHKQHRIEQKNEYRKTIKGRASYLRDGYIHQDKRDNNGECTLTTDDIVELLNQGCYWCGETDWHKLGADRLDNSKPHTKENCVCACLNCNLKRQRKSEMKKVIQYTKDGDFVNEFESTLKASKLTGINQGNISLCCLGKRKSAGGYVWQFVA